MKSKTLMNLLPIVIMAGICGVGAYQQWQRIQLSRPAYDSSSSSEQPVGVVAEANQIQIPQTERWQVVKVSDGDTIVVRKGIRQERIRLAASTLLNLNSRLESRAKPIYSGSLVREIIR
jgi:hypothetical protein